MGQHYIDPVQYFLNKDNTSPVRVDVDAPQQHPDAAGVWRRIEFTYEDGCQIILDGENKDKDVAYIEGPKGKLYPGFRSDIPDLEKKQIGTAQCRLRVGPSVSISVVAISVKQKNRTITLHHT